MQDQFAIECYHQVPTDLPRQSITLRHSFRWEQWRVFSTAIE